MEDAPNNCATTKPGRKVKQKIQKHKHSGLISGAEKGTTEKMQSDSKKFMKKLN